MNQELEKLIAYYERLINQKARKNRWVSIRETIILSCHIKDVADVTWISEDILQMSVEDFFAVHHLIAYLPQRNAIRASNALTFLRPTWVLARDGYSFSRIETMEDFLAEFPDSFSLFRIKNLGRECIPGVMKLMRQAKLPITDHKKFVV